VQGDGATAEPGRVVIDEQHPRPGGQPLIHLAAKHLAGRDVQTRPCLVEHEQSGPGEQSLRDGDLLRRPLGQLT
jgi:hypothetical protein